MNLLSLGLAANFFSNRGNCFIYGMSGSSLEQTSTNWLNIPSLVCVRSLGSKCFAPLFFGLLVYYLFIHCWYVCICFRCSVCKRSRSGVLSRKRAKHQISTYDPLVLRIQIFITLLQMYGTSNWYGVGFVYYHYEPNQFRVCIEASINNLPSLTLYLTLNIFNT